ncbi:hypothetical protein EBQ74_00430 [bacterium]|nr:hypothetical protein [bacterium]
MIKRSPATATETIRKRDKDNNFFMGTPYAFSNSNGLMVRIILLWEAEWLGAAKEANSVLFKEKRCRAHLLRLRSAPFCFPLRNRPLQKSFLLSRS